MKMKKTAFVLLLVSFSISFCEAQSLKAAAEKKESDLKKQAQAAKAQLNLNDLLLLQKKDLNYIEDYLSSRNWDLHKTGVDNVLDFGYWEDWFVSYDEIIWSYNKNRWNDKAEAWFYLYYFDKMENAIVYQIHDKEKFAQFKKEFQNSTVFKHIQTKAINEGLESRYRSKNLEVILWQRQSEEGDYKIYQVYIYNYKEIEHQKKMADEQAQREYEERLRLEQEKLRLEQEKQMKAEKYQSFIQQAEDLKKRKNYDNAKAAYQNALDTKSEEATYILNKIAEIDEIVKFIGERTWKVYNYADYFASDYDRTNENIISDIKNVLSSENGLNPATITMTATIDTAGNTSTTFAAVGMDEKLKEKLKQIADNIRLQQPSLNGYTVSAKAVFDYTVSTEESIIKVKKSASGIDYDNTKYNTYRYEIDKTLSSAPMGKFTFRFNKITINSKGYTDDKLLKYKGTGRGTNAWLSLLVPGLGDHRVTYGSRKGIGIALSTYGLIGAGIGCKLYSNAEYAKYHAATQQADMDTYYNRANLSNQAFYICIGAGAILWIYDIIWVWNKGVKNKKEQKIWERSHLSFYYNPNFEATGLTYTLTF